MIADTEAPSSTSKRTSDAAPPDQQKPGKSGEARNDLRDAGKVRALMERCIADAKGNRIRLERDRADIQNLMMYRGGEKNHWAILNTHTNEFEERPYDGPHGIPAWIKRCTTNKLAVHIDGTAAILNQSSPAKSFAPSTDDDADRATAEVCEDADPVLLDEIGYEALKRRMHQLIALTDKVAIVYWFDNDPKYGTYPVPMMHCLDCNEVMTPMETGGSPVEAMQGDDSEPEQACPHCSSPNITVAQDPLTGIPIGTDYPRGKLCADLYTSYEFSLPQSAKVADEEKNPWVLGHSTMAIEDACRSFSEFAAEIRKQGSISPKFATMTRQYAEQMRSMASPDAARTGRNNEVQQKMVTVYRLQHDPITEDEFSFPDGLHAVMVGDVLVQAEELPIEDENGYRKKSIIIRQFADVPGTPFGKPPADDLVPMQQLRNLRETQIYIHDMFMALPHVFLPAGVTLEDDWQLVPGGLTRFRSTHPGEHPITEQGTSAPEGLYKSIDKIDADMQEVSRLNAVLQGQRPEGDPTLGEIQILQERGMAAFRTPLDHLIAFERKQSQLLLNLARKTAWAPRFRKVEGENGRWNVTQFTAADLTGRIDISIEPLSAWPKSPSMELVKLQKAIQMGVVAPQADPEVATKVLVTLGLSHMKPSLDADRKQVAREIDRWKAATTPDQITPPNPDIINPQIHLFLKQQFLKSEEAEQLAQANPPVFQAMVQHVQQLKQAMQPPPPKPAEPPKTTLGLKGEDLTNPEVIQMLQHFGIPIEAATQAPQQPQQPQSPLSHLVASGTLKPAGGTPPSPLPQLVKSGAIAPAGAAQQPQSPLSGLIHSGALQPAGAAAQPPQPPAPRGPSIDDLMKAGVMAPAPRIPPGGPPPPAR